MEASAPASCDRNSVHLESWRRQRRWGLGPSLHGRSGGGWAAKSWEPSAAGPTPTCGSRAAAPERGLVHRRRLQPSTSRRGCCSAAAAARSLAGPEPGFPPPPRAGWRFRSGGEAAAAAPSRLSRVSCQPAVSPRSAAPPPPLLPPPLPHPQPPEEPPPPPPAALRPLPLALLLPAHCFPSPRRPGSAGVGLGRQRRRPPRGRRSPQPTIHRAAPPGRESCGRGLGRGRGERSPPRQRGYGAGAAGVPPERDIPRAAPLLVLSQPCTQMQKPTPNSTFPHDPSPIRRCSQEYSGKLWAISRETEAVVGLSRASPEPLLHQLDPYNKHISKQ
ncbi:formin-like protein 3 [Pteropus medius]|uniref:formin-like protein 3 n=1 Tax=Pteropus vampyrus TaxID=132908 RepID=UPI00196A4406|nr:formin-like protein 3 [Pteropus giganteus]